jgi:predicted enzyme related to lactoylglutathione lyase/predicted kinase
MPTKYAHTNLIAKDWRRLASFYREVFGCVPVPPERDLSGEWIDKATGITGAHIFGMHLRLPGFGGDGPTLEIFQYGSMPEHPSVQPNTPGFTHIAFAVDEVPSIAQAVFAHGGSAVGELTVREVPGVGLLTFQYVADPEGNIIEVQNWNQRMRQSENAVGEKEREIGAPDSALTSKQDKILIATVGLPRSGKTTWALSQAWPIVNPDSIRLAIHGQRFLSRAEPFVWATAKAMVRALFLAGHKIVILDATNTRRKLRDEWQSEDWATFFKVMDTGAEICLERAAEQRDAEIIPVIERMAARYEPLGHDEKAWPEN